MDNALIFIAAVVMGCVTVFACVLMSPGQRLSIAGLLIIPQFYVPGLPFPVADGWLILMAGVALFDKRIVAPKISMIYIIFGIFFVYLLAHSWSADPFDPASLMLTLRVFLYGTLICYAYSVAVNEPDQLRSALKFATPWILLQAAMTFLFRFNTSLEYSFLGSATARLLVGPSARDLFTISPNNVLDPDKAGGLFVNGNVASMFGGVAAFLLFAAARQGWSRWYYSWAFLAWGSAIATGSKTGVSLAVVIPLLCWVLSKTESSRSRFMLAPLALAAVGLLFLIPSWIESAFPSFADKSINAYGTRSNIWGSAYALFKDSPLLGLGYGGWADATRSMAAVNGFPPHNMIIAAWSVGGIFAALLILFLCISTILWCGRLVIRAEAPEGRLAAACALCGFLWIFVHSMGDNTTFYGEPRTMLLATMLFALVFLTARLPNSPGTKRSSLHDGYHLRATVGLKDGRDLRERSFRS